MRDQLEAAIELQSRARSLRKKGDALRKVGREELAERAFVSALEALLSAHGQLEDKDRILRSTDTSSQYAEDTELFELVEIYGALGGVYQRLGQLESALASYEEGSFLEQKFQLTSTYNRLNAVKYSLLTGPDLLESQIAGIQSLADRIHASIMEDKALSDEGWAWADYADCLAFLGRTEEAGRAYATFIAKAEIKSPERTLDVLSQIASKLASKGDPDAPRLTNAIDTLKGHLGT